MPALWTGRTLPTVPWTARSGLPTCPQPLRLLRFAGGSQTRKTVTHVPGLKRHLCSRLHKYEARNADHITRSACRLAPAGHEHEHGHGLDHRSDQRSREGGWGPCPRLSPTGCLTRARSVFMMPASRKLRGAPLA